MKVINQIVCDLRHYNTPEAMKKIKGIRNVALVLVPKVMDDATRAAYAKIEKKNTASEIEVDSDHSPLIFNGDTEITDASLPDGESAIIVNGSARMFRLSPCPFRFISDPQPHLPPRNCLYSHRHPSGLGKNF